MLQPCIPSCIQTKGTFQNYLRKKQSLGCTNKMHQPAKSRTLRCTAVGRTQKIFYGRFGEETSKNSLLVWLWSCSCMATKIPFALEHVCCHCVGATITILPALLGDTPSQRKLQLTWIREVSLSRNCETRPFGGMGLSGCARIQNNGHPKNISSTLRRSYATLIARCVLHPKLQKRRIHNGRMD